MTCGFLVKGDLDLLGDFPKVILAYTLKQREQQEAVKELFVLHRE